MLKSVRPVFPVVFALASLLGCGEKKGGNQDESQSPPTGQSEESEETEGTTPEESPAENSDPTPAEQTSPAPGESEHTHKQACEESWKKVIINAPVGRLIEHEYNDVASNGDGGETRFTSKTIQLVTESGPEQYTLEITRQKLLPTPAAPVSSSITIVKKDFITRCLEESPDQDVKVPEGYTYELVEKRAEKITVPAGTFDVKFLHYRVSGNELGTQFDSDVKVWKLADGSGIAVKSVSDNTSKSSEMTRKNRSENVLIKFESPAQE